MKQSHWTIEIWLLIYWQVWKISKISLYCKVRTCNYCLSLVKSQSTSNVNAVVSATDSVDLEIAPSKSEEEHFDQLHPEVQIYWQFCLTDNKLKIFFCTIESELIWFRNWTKNENMEGLTIFHILPFLYLEMRVLLRCWPNPGSARKLRNIESCDGEILKWKMEIPSYVRPTKQQEWRNIWNQIFLLFQELRKPTFV